MAEESRFRKLLIELRPHAIWEVLRWIGPIVGAAMLSTFIGLVQKFRHVSFDWFLLGGIFSISFLIFMGLLYLARRLGTPSEQQSRAIEQRIAKLESELDQERKARETQLPAARPKIVPIRWGKGPDRRTGLIIRNDGEPAFDITVDDPIQIGTATLDFRNRVHSGLTQAEGTLLAEACIRLSQGSITGGDALRDLMVKADLAAISLVIRYRDINSQAYVTRCDVVNEFWGEGLRISGVRQERA
jgi:hypothetical protein